MNNYLKIIFIMKLFLINFISCNEQGNTVRISSENIITIEDYELKDHYKESDVFSSVELIPLETTDLSLIGAISKIVVKDSVIYILDPKSKSILLFNKKGKYLNKIRNIGLGPNEYIEASDFTLLTNNDIMVLDAETGRFIQFKKDGTPFRTYNLPFSADGVECINDSLFAFNGSSYEDKLIVWNMMENKVINSFFDYDQRYSTRILKPLIKYDHSVYFTLENSSVIYDVTDDEPREKWYIDFGKRNININTLKEVEFGMYAKNSSVAEMNEFSETTGHVLFSFQCEDLNEYPYYVCYSKKTGKKRILTHDYYISDLTFSLYPPDIITATDTDQLVACFWAYDLLEKNVTYNDAKMEERTLQRWLEYREKVKDVKEFDNPVIGSFSLKDF